MSYQRARELIDVTVLRHIEAWAKIIGLQSTGAPFAQFREDIEGPRRCTTACGRISLMAPQIRALSAICAETS